MICDQELHLFQHLTIISYNHHHFIVIIITSSKLFQLDKSDTKYMIIVDF